MESAYKYPPMSPLLLQAAGVLGLIPPGIPSALTDTW